MFLFPTRKHEENKCSCYKLQILIPQSGALMVQVAECPSICVFYFLFCNEAAQRIYSPIKGMTADR
jgi:hypothetical protein